MPKVLTVNLARTHAELLEGTGSRAQYAMAVLCSCVSVSRLKVVLTVAALRTRSEFNRRCTDESSEKIQADGNLSHAEGLGSNLAMVNMLHLDG